MVHPAVRKVGPILGGVTTLVQALLDAVGDAGTLVAYVDWEIGFESYAVKPALESDMPAFDKRIARAAREYGILPEVIRTWPGAFRSDNPDAGIAALRSLLANCGGGDSASRSQPQPQLASGEASRTVFLSDSQHRVTRKVADSQFV